jgi:hypothetical protein
MKMSLDVEVEVVGEEDVFLRYLRNHDAHSNDDLAAESMEPDVSYYIVQPSEDQENHPGTVVVRGNSRESLRVFLDEAPAGRRLHVVRHTVIGDVSFAYGILSEADDSILASFVGAARMSPRGLISHYHAHVSGEFSLFPDLMASGGTLMPSDG